jgi:hAT family C-terminal dimerisation region
VPKPQPDEYDLLAQELDVVNATSSIDEYETFTSQMPISIECSPLIWWLRDEQREHYPNLSKMAIDILSIPAMSADPQRVFSGARRTTSWDRMLLGASTVERGKCLKSWIRSGITRGLPAEVIDEHLEENEILQEKITTSQEDGDR